MVFAVAVSISVITVIAVAIVMWRWKIYWRSAFAGLFVVVITLVVCGAVVDQARGPHEVPMANVVEPISTTVIDYIFDESSIMTANGVFRISDLRKASALPRVDEVADIYCYEDSCYIDPSKQTATAFTYPDRPTGENYRGVAMLLFFVGVMTPVVSLFSLFDE